MIHQESRRVPGKDCEIFQPWGGFAVRQQFQSHEVRCFGITLDLVVAIQFSLKSDTVVDEGTAEFGQQMSYAAPGARLPIDELETGGPRLHQYVSQFFVTQVGRDDLGDRHFEVSRVPFQRPQDRYGLIDSQGHFVSST
jgi:hypothetical protein